MFNTKVLLSNDRSIGIQNIKVLLDEQEGIEVIGEAMDFRQTIEKAKELYPDVIVFCATMPNRIGNQVVREIKKTNSKVNVIF
jgi:DNA-binding NarL/FixJ family response regulator